MQVWDWGGVALCSMLSVLIAMWYVRICSMLTHGLKERKAPQATGRPSTPLSSAMSGNKLIIVQGQQGTLGVQKGIKEGTGVYLQQYDWPR